MSSSAEIVLGVDGGGTSTRAVLADRTGRVLGVGRAGPSNYHAVGVEAARRSIEMAVAGAWDEAALERSSCGSAFLGMAGVIGTRDAAVIRTIAEELHLAEQIGVDHDIRTALAGGVGEDQGVALIAGTGSSCYGRSTDGRTHRAGGWGNLFDDAGGAYRIALDGLDAATRAIDGRGEMTLLATTLPAALGVADPDELPAALLGTSGTHTAIAGLAPLVLDAAAEGDAVALATVRHNANELALMVEAVVRKLGWRGTPPNVVLVGGTVSTPFYRSLTVERIVARLGYNPVVEVRMPPSLGAVLLALLALGPVANSTHERLAESAHNPRLR